MPVDTEYEEDARRIERDYVNPESTDQDSIKEDLRDAGFAEGAIKEIVDQNDWITTTEDVGGPADAPHANGVTTREEVARAVNDADTIGYTDARKEALTSAVSREIGAPTQSELQSAQFQTVAQESVTPGEVIEGDSRSTPSSVIRDTDGGTVGIVGPPGSGEDVAEAMGAEYLGSSPDDFASDLSVQPAPDGNRGLLYYGGNAAIGEVDLE